LQAANVTVLMYTKSQIKNFVIKQCKNGISFQQNTRLTTTLCTHVHNKNFCMTTDHI